MDVHFESSRSLQEICDVGVRRGYLDPDNPLRPSIVADALFDRRNTGDNTPCVLHVELVPGKTVEVDVAATGGGSDNKDQFAMLNPNESIDKWVLSRWRTQGGGGWDRKG